MALWPAVAALDDHWTWRPDWTTERTCLLWYLTFPGQSELRELAAATRRGLAGLDTVDPVPEPWLHLTLDDVGFEDEISDDHLDGVVAAVFEAVAEHPLPEIELGPLTTMTDCLVLGVEPEEALVSLRDRLREGTERVLPGSQTLLDEFWPHVTLAYSNARVDRHTLMRPLAHLTESRLRLTPVLMLAAVTRRERHYRWTARAVIPG